MAETPDSERAQTGIGGSGTLHDQDHDQDDGEQPPARTSAGPYELRELIGVGGMGVVHRGWDPRLRRAVAIKLLRTGSLSGRSPEAARARLVREAQALARFSHPNVVQVFDVGTTGDTVWVAMELVEGTTLGRWLEDDPRSTRDVLRAFIEAGRGLAAAHAQGLVHRDFKPDNVFVGRDPNGTRAFGRVCVGDFGLVRAASPTSMRPRSRDSPAAHRDSNDATSLGATALTRDGLVLGTPAYMAPEQHYGEPTDARTDQYAFCVALWEALHGQRPFRAASAAELAEQKRTRTLPRPDPGASVSTALGRAIVRGLHPSPEGRFPSMEPLLATLERDVRPGRPRIALMSVAVAALAAAIVLSVREGDGSCEAGEDRLHAVWSPTRQDAASSAFRATSLPYAADTWERVEPSLEAWAGAWASTHVEVCRATRAGTQTQAELDARMRCLDGMLARFDGLVGALAGADRGVVVGAAMVVRGLPSPTTCASRAASDDASLPDDPARARRVEALLARLRRHTGAAQAGALTEAIADAERLLAEAREIGWDPLTAQVEHAVGSAYEAAGRYDQAVEHMQAALHLASAAGDDAEAAEAATELVWIHGRHLADAEAAHRWLPHAMAAVERLDDEPLHVARLVNVQGLVAGLDGRVDDACDAYTEAHRLYEAELGPEHPDTLTAITNLGAMEMQRGEYARARDLHARVLGTLEGIYGPLHPEIAITLINLANARTRLGELAEATEEMERAIRIRRAALGDAHPEVATALNNLGAIEEARGHFEDAERTHRDALRRFEAALPPGHPNIGASMTNVGSTLERQGRYDEAIDFLERGRSILVEALPPEHPYLVYADVSLGAALRGAGRSSDARAALERAAAACVRGTIEPGLCALADFERARIGWDEPAASRAESIDLARHALQTLEATPFAVSTDRIDEMRAWMHEHETRGDP